MQTLNRPRLSRELACVAHIADMAVIGRQNGRKLIVHKRNDVFARFVRPTTASEAANAVKFGLADTSLASHR
ncbi:conserved hypothetical protein [Stutzerimonas stutzeri A1501]|uniref:Uncharacterized protein n=1 Tax=Stutzerimonas stutzeri (strain A1501) TaxID=379731 RepID=A4VP26_STUS1|nr:conserved hypothetical protein [Stutzerimonas stutzeri A1501]